MRRSTLLTALLGLMSLVVLAAPAQAAQPIEHEHFSNPGETIIETDFCGFPEVELHLVEDVMFLTQIRGNSEFPYVAAIGKETLTWTNPETGNTFTVVNRFTDKALHVVDNGDGTLTVTFSTTVNRRVFADGEFLFADRGRVTGSVLIEHQGTLTPEDDVFLGDVTEPRFSGNWTTVDRDFCEDFIQFTS